MRKINVVVMTLAGLLLVVAAILKAHEVLTVYFPSWRAWGVGVVGIFPVPDSC